MGKVLCFIFFFIWLRGTLPRLRYDQFMAFGWKRLIPVSLVWIVAVATVRAITLEGEIDRSYLLIGIGVIANDEFETNIDEGTEITVPISVEGDGILERVGTLLADVDSYAA